MRARTPLALCNGGARARQLVAKTFNEETAHGVGLPADGGGV
jgi:hypothetical protein